MTTTDLPFRATTDEACHWLAQQTATPWTLARLIEHGVTPYVWLDYDAAYPELFGDANGGYAAPIFLADDTARLAAGSDDVLITMTKDAYNIVTRLPPPGFRRALHELRFLKKDLTRLVAQLQRDAEPAMTPPVAESQSGITKDQVLAAFASHVKLNLAQSLDAAGGVFGDDGARIKSSTKKAKNKIQWNPVTLAIGLHEVHRAPIGPLKRAFAAHDFLQPWSAQWNETLSLLGK